MFITCSFATGAIVFEEIDFTSFYASSVLKIAITACWWKAERPKWEQGKQTN